MYLGHSLTSMMEPFLRKQKVGKISSTGESENELVDKLVKKMLYVDFYFLSQ